MTNRPDPTPEHPPERIDNWAEWSAAQARALHGVTVVHAPTLDALLDRYIQVTDELAGLNKYFIQRLAEVKAELVAARADATRLRERATLTDLERKTIAIASIAASREVDDLLLIIARLATHDTAPGGETR